MWSVDSEENHENGCHQKSDFMAKMHQIQILLEELTARDVNPVGHRRPGLPPKYFAKGAHPSMPPPSPNNYAATCHKVTNVLRTVPGT